MRNLERTQGVNTRDESGFTLVELLVVILIIGVLAAIAIPAFMNQRQKANDATLESDMKNMVTLMHTYFLDDENVETAKTAAVTSVGWTLVAHGSSDASFVGTQSTGSTGTPSGFPSFTLSEGVGIGIAASTTGGRRAPGEFCIVGNMVNSSYAADSSNWENSLYFDSRHGKISPGTELQPNGSCHSYYLRWSD